MARLRPLRGCACGALPGRSPPCERIDRQGECSRGPDSHSKLLERVASVARPPPPRQAGGGSCQGLTGSLATSLGEIDEIEAEAQRLNHLPLLFRERLVRGELQSGEAHGRLELERLEREADEKGFRFIADRARGQICWSNDPLAACQPLRLNGIFFGNGAGNHRRPSFHFRKAAVFKEPLPYKGPSASVKRQRPAEWAFLPIVDPRGTHSRIDGYPNAITRGGFVKISAIGPARAAPSGRWRSPIRGASATLQEREESRARPRPVTESSGDPGGSCAAACPESADGSAGPPRTASPRYTACWRPAPRSHAPAIRARCRCCRPCRTAAPC